MTTHTLKWEGVWRELGCLARSASFAVREESGHSLKSSLSVRLVLRSSQKCPAMYAVEKEFKCKHNRGHRLGIKWLTFCPTMIFLNLVSSYVRL